MKVFWAALLAVVVGSVVTGLFWLFTFIGIAGSLGSGKSVAVMPNSILKIDLADNIVDSPTINPFAGMNFTNMSPTRTLPLLKVLRAIETAATDDNIKGIYINVDLSAVGSVSSAALEEIRQALEQFKSSGKFIVAYNDIYPQTIYYLASVADKIYLQPEGSFDWHGMASVLLFYKGALDKLGIHAEAFRPTVCKYKSAVEPYLLTKMSDANRRQMEELGRGMWNTISTAVATSRGTTVEALNKIADTTPTLFPEQALEHKLIDGIIYRDQMDEIFEQYGVQRNFMNEFEYITLGDYCSVMSDKNTNLSAPKIGIVYAEGSIVDGENKAIDGNIYGTTLANTIAKVRKDESIKAVVLRVNSPGGSALASDVIWREMELLKAAKPVIVSMGAYAASGGYYISAPADAIVANNLTVTGSIGVFGIMLEGGDMLKNKLGITYDAVKTNPSADYGAGFLGLALRKPTASERAMLIKSVDKVYESFTGKVAAGRNLELQKVLDIAEGRVWSGAEAVKIGLADANGGIKTAISVAADKAGISENFRIEEVLPEMDQMTALLQSLGTQMRAYTLSDELNSVCTDYQTLKNDILRSGVQTYCPYRVTF